MARISRSICWAAVCGCGFMAWAATAEAQAAGFPKCDTPIGRLSVDELLSCLSQEQGRLDLEEARSIEAFREALIESERLRADKRAAANRAVGHRDPGEEPLCRPPYRMTASDGCQR